MRRSAAMGISTRSIATHRARSAASQGPTQYDPLYFTRLGVNHTEVHLGI